MRLPEPWHVIQFKLKPWRLDIVLIFIAIFLLGLATPLRGNSQPSITFERFSEQMLKGHDVDHVTTYRSGDLLNVEVYLKKESFTKLEYADAPKKESVIRFGGKDAPQYVFAAATYDGLAKAINDAEARFGYAEADKVPVLLEQGHESLFSNWFVQCIIMIFLLVLFALCGYLGYKEGKKRIIGPIAGLVLGIVFGPAGLIVVYVTDKKPPQENDGIQV